jgi:hypothetical protein
MSHRRIFAANHARDRRAGLSSRLHSRGLLASTIISLVVEHPYLISSIPEPQLAEFHRLMNEEIEDVASSS